MKHNLPTNQLKNMLFSSKFVDQSIVQRILSACQPLLGYFLFIYGGARGVMVIVVENGHDDTSSNPGWDWLHFT